MCGYEKLAIRKNHPQFINDLTLPFGMQMQFKLINKYNAISLKRIIKCRIANGKTSGYVTDQCQVTLFTIRKLLYTKYLTIFTQFESCRTFTPGVQLTIARHNQRNGLSHYRQLLVLIFKCLSFLALLTLDVLTFAIPFIERPQITPTLSFTFI